jgi:hypothetical protein
MKTCIVLNLAVFLFFVGLGAGCSKQAANPAERRTPPKPKEAASQLDQAFAGANNQVKSQASTASQALQSADYEKAAASLQMIKEQGNLTVDQGMAVHNSMISLEQKLISAMEAGDPNAKRAYEQLKRSRRN